MDEERDDAVLRALARNELRLASLEQRMVEGQASGERRLVSLEQRMVDVETRHVSTIDQTEFERLLLLALASDRVTRRLGDMFTTVLATSDMLTATALRNWLGVLFAGLAVLFVLVQYLHP